jgi:hypothetical protein
VVVWLAGREMTGLVVLVGRGEVEVIDIMEKGRRRSGEAALCLRIPLDEIVGW